MELNRPLPNVFLFQLRDKTKLLSVALSIEIVSPSPRFIELPSTFLVHVPEVGQTGSPFAAVKPVELNVIVSPLKSPEAFAPSTVTLWIFQVPDCSNENTSGLGASPPPQEEIDMSATKKDSNTIN